MKKLFLNLKINETLLILTNIIWNLDVKSYIMSHYYFGNINLVMLFLYPMKLESMNLQIIYLY